MSRKGRRNFRVVCLVLLVLVAGWWLRSIFRCDSLVLRVRRHVAALEADGGVLTLVVSPKLGKEVGSGWNDWSLTPWNGGHASGPAAPPPPAAGGEMGGPAKDAGEAMTGDPAGAAGLGSAASAAPSAAAAPSVQGHSLELLQFGLHAYREKLGDDDYFVFGAAAPFWFVTALPALPLVRWGWRHFGPNRQRPRRHRSASAWEPQAGNAAKWEHAGGGAADESSGQRPRRRRHRERRAHRSGH